MVWCRGREATKQQRQWLIKTHTSPLSYQADRLNSQHFNEAKTKIFLFYLKGNETREKRMWFHVHWLSSITTAFLHWKWKRKKNKKTAIEVRSWIGYYGIWRKIKTIIESYENNRVLFVFLSRFDFDGKHRHKRVSRIQSKQWPLKLAHRSIYCVSGSCAPRTNSLPHTFRHRNVSTQSILSGMDKMVNANDRSFKRTMLNGFSRANSYEQKLKNDHFVWTRSGATAIPIHSHNNDTPSTRNVFFFRHSTHINSELNVNLPSSIQF